MSVSICLNMIVRNESTIIRRLFDSVLPIIDTYCICDTGSTDNTKEVIREYFSTKDIMPALPPKQCTQSSRTCSGNNSEILVEVFLVSVAINYKMMLLCMILQH